MHGYKYRPRVLLRLGREMLQFRRVVLGRAPPHIRGKVPRIGVLPGGVGIIACELCPSEHR